MSHGQNSDNYEGIIEEYCNRVFNNELLGLIEGVLTMAHVSYHPCQGHEGNIKDGPSTR